MSWITQPLKNITSGEVVRGRARSGKKITEASDWLRTPSLPVCSFSHISASALVISAQLEESGDGPCCVACFYVCSQWPNPQQEVTRSTSHLSWVRFPESRHWSHIDLEVGEVCRKSSLGQGGNWAGLGREKLLSPLVGGILCWSPSQWRVSQPHGGALELGRLHRTVLNGGGVASRWFCADLGR